jgi:hypothetical protein
MQTTDDDQAVENNVTVSRINGGSANWMVTAGNLSTATIGDYPAAYDLNVYTDAQLLPQAQWRAAVGTIDEPRRPSVALDAIRLVAVDRTSLVAMREGGRFTVTSVANLLAPTLASQIECMVLGWTETITETAWHFDINTRPMNPYQQVLILDDTTYGILDTDRLAL